MVTNLAAVLGHELIDPAAAVAAHLSLKEVFLAQAGKEFAVLAHDVTRQVVQADPGRPDRECFRAGRGGFCGWTAIGARPVTAVRPNPDMGRSARITTRLLSRRTLRATETAVYPGLSFF